MRKVEVLGLEKADSISAIMCGARDDQSPEASLRNGGDKLTEDPSFTDFESGDMQVAHIAFERAKMLKRSLSIE
jgi:hypothetical protein